MIKNFFLQNENMFKKDLYLYFIFNTNIFFVKIFKYIFEMRYIFFTFSFILFSVKKSFFNKSNFHYKTFFPYNFFFLQKKIFSFATNEQAQTAGRALYHISILNCFIET